MASYVVGVVVVAAGLGGADDVHDSAGGGNGRARGDGLGIGGVLW